MRPSFKQAIIRYPNRFTMDYMPAWARNVRQDGTYYAPHYRSDREWYENTKFPGEHGHIGSKDYCYSTNQSWPLGKNLTHIASEAASKREKSLERIAKLEPRALGYKGHAAGSRVADLHREFDTKGLDAAIALGRTVGYSPSTTRRLAEKWRS